MQSVSPFPPPPPISGRAAQVAADLFANVTLALRGKPDQARLALAGLLSGGHLLIEDVPGVGKTLLAKAIARSVGGTFRRVQGTPDLLPADLTGVTIFRRQSETWEFQPGPLFANVVLLDEINRATPRTQAATLEAMEERQVTVDGHTHALPDPFLLIATQNPFEHAGTFPLVEGQRDRFSLVLELGLPGRESERELLLGHGGTAALARLKPVTDPTALANAIAEVHRVPVHTAVTDYVLDITAATRSHPMVSLGASPRASLSLLRVAQAHATIVGRSFVAPDDVKRVAAAVLGHRIILSGGDLRTATAVIDEILAKLAVPRG
ncbi:MAG: MoxR family ATPase [Acidimicrobiia bacterium]|nr:MoxR family ATPase [Acidimicrobiia bacterium]